MFSPGFCLSLQVGKGKMLKGEGKDWEWNRGRERGRVGRRKWGERGGREEKREGGLERGGYGRLPPEPPALPSAHLRPEGNGVKGRQVSCRFSFQDIQGPDSLLPLWVLLLSLFHLLPASNPF